jgi:glycosyltransferase involved in cell wall biosynthesis
MLTVQGSRSADTLRGFGKRNVSVIPTVCDTSRVRRTVSLVTKYDIVYLGRFSWEKRPDRFVQIIERLALIRRNLKAVMLGSGRLELQIRRQVAEAGLGNIIEIIGWTDMVQEYLIESKVFLLTSDKDQLPLALLEAMAAGAVPVASNVGNVCDVVDERTGFLVSPNDISAYVEAVTILLCDEELRTRKSLASKERIINRFSITSNTQRWTKLISDIFSHRK